MKKHIKNCVINASLAFLTACSHTPPAVEPVEIDESSSRERLILSANVEKVAVETATHTLLFNSNIMAGYVHHQVIYAKSSCAPYTRKQAVEFPVELKEAYSKVLHTLHDLDAINENDMQAQKSANEADIDKIQTNVREIRSYCENKFGF